MVELVLSKYKVQSLIASTSPQVKILMLRARQGGTGLQPQLHSHTSLNHKRERGSKSERGRDGRERGRQRNSIILKN